MKNHAVLHIKYGLFVKSLIFINDVHNSKKKLPSLHVNLKRTKFSEVNTPSNWFFELNFLSLLYVIMVKRKVFCHFFGLWVGPSRMRCRHFKSESCARKKFCSLFCSIFFSLVRYLYNARINDQEGEKRMGFF